MRERGEGLEKQRERETESEKVGEIDNGRESNKRENVRNRDRKRKSDIERER